MDKKRLQDLLDAETEYWSRKSFDSLVTELSDVVAYGRGSDADFHWFEVQMIEHEPGYVHVVVSIDDVIEKKMACVEALESQFYEGGCCSGVTSLPTDGPGQAARKKLVYDNFKGRFGATAARFRKGLKDFHGDKDGGEAAYAEAFELCEYGRQPSREELHQLFPFAKK